MPKGTVMLTESRSAPTIYFSLHNVLASPFCRCGGSWFRRRARLRRGTCPASKDCLRSLPIPPIGFLSDKKTDATAGLPRTRSSLPKGGSGHKGGFL